MNPHLARQHEMIAKLRQKVSDVAAMTTGALLAHAGEGSAQLLRMAQEAGLGVDSSHAAQYLAKNILTESAEMRRQIRHAAAIASHTSAEECVIITGESGTGKETFARAFAADGLPFVAVNCTSLPDYLVESELFGHKRGAFTGAIDDRVGLFQQAGRGVLFIDEIGDMPETMQPKLLRVLQDRRVRAVGSNAEVPIECRVVSATHRDPRKVLRNDLYWRLCTHMIDIPPLRNRIQDARLYINKYAPGLFSDNDIDELLGRSLTGNYRELQQIIARRRVQHVLAIAGTPPAS